MKFETEQELRRIAGELAEADFERADCRFDKGGTFALETARPAAQNLKGAGLFRKGQSDWIRCELLIRHLRGLSIWEEFDVKPPLGSLVEMEKTAEGFSIRLRSAHGLRVDLQVSRLEGELRDLP